MLKLVALVALFAGFCWVGTHLQLGPHTLFGHLRAIAQTKESQELFDGTRASAQPLVDDVRRRIAGVPAPAKEKDPAVPVEETDDAPEHKIGQSRGEVARADEAKPGKLEDAKPGRLEDAKPGRLEDAKPGKLEDAKSGKSDVAKLDKPKGGPAQETLTPSERRRLRRLISAAEGASARQ
jgi:hypothetical protein